MNQRIGALIVDDEAPARAVLRHMLSGLEDWRIVAECVSAAAARAVLSTQAVDVVFLDIRMPGGSGLEVARELAERAHPPLVIFVTAFDEHAIEAFELHALDYLLKPYNDDRLQAALQRAAQMLALRQQAVYAAALRGYATASPHYWEQVCIRSVGHIEVIQLSAVHWIEGAGNYVQLRLDGRCLLHRVPMRSLEVHLDPARFLRVHRCAIVQTDQMLRLHTVTGRQYELELRCGARVPVSERHVQEVRARLGDR